MGREIAEKKSEGQRAEGKSARTREETCHGKEGQRHGHVKEKDGEQTARCMIGKRKEKSTQRQCDDRGADGTDAIGYKSTGRFAESHAEDGKQAPYARFPRESERQTNVRAEYNHRQ